MSLTPSATPLVAAVPAVTPFVAPEELARRAGRDSLLRLGANESSFGPSPAAIAAMRDGIAHTNWYGDPESVELRDAIAERHGVARENVTIGSGIDDLMSLLVRTFCAPGDASLATAGTYPTWTYHVLAYGARHETAPPTAAASIDVDALIARARGWRPAGPYRLEGWGWTVNFLALAYGVAAIVNILWPRSPNDPWFVNYAMLVTTVGVVVLGGAYMMIAKPYERGNAPAGDAHLLGRAPRGPVGQAQAPIG